ncbi:MAG: gliding motility-associated C-terminal domain-containing protein, partial [Crocinitomicaceae bacterium]|nr:gliding motility-associated C-terminal domain-containing protein [Crocinitomicaceae bacterium]
KSKDNCIAVTSTAFNFNPIVYSATPILADVKTKYCYGATSDSLNPKLNNLWYDSQDHSVLPNQLLVSGKYYVSAKESGKCESQKLEVDVQISNLKVSQMSLTPTECNKQTGAIQVQPYGGFEPYTYKWISNETFNNTSSTRLNNLSKGKYQLVAIDGIGCADTSLYIVDCEVSKIPQIVSPNNDGKNEKWEINYATKYPKVKVQIFNRWGTMVYQSIPYQDDWNGVSNTLGTLGNTELPTGTYYYIIDKGNEEDIESGYLELVK